MMNNLKVSMVILAMTLAGSQANSQTINKIGVGFTSDPLNALTLDYSKVKDSGKTFNFRLSYGEESLFSRYSRQIVIPDSPDENPYLSEKNLGRYTNKIKLVVGPEFQIKETKFSWGLEGIAGVGFYDETLSQSNFQTTENGTIDENSAFAIPIENITILENVDRVLFSPGIQGRFSFNTEFSERLGLQLFVSSSLEQDFTINTETKLTSEDNELSSEKFKHFEPKYEIRSYFFSKEKLVYESINFKSRLIFKWLFLFLF